MAKIEKFEGEVEMKSNAEKVFDLWVHKLPQISTICPDKLPLFELHEGDWNSSGSVITWHYNMEGKRECGKSKVEIDEESKLLTYKLMDGKGNNHLKIITSTIQVIPKSEGCTMIFTYFYEKIDESAEEPTMYLDFILGCAKAVDAHLCAASGHYTHLLFY